MSNAARTLAFTLDLATSTRLERLAHARQQPADELMFSAVSQYLDREERQDAFRRDTENSWSDYQATGLHVTAEEADAWLAKLEAGEDAAPPACHT